MCDSNIKRMFCNRIQTSAPEGSIKRPEGRNHQMHSVSWVGLWFGLRPVKDIWEQIVGLEYGVGIRQDENAFTRKWENLK